MMSEVVIVESDDRPPRYVEGDTVIYRASSLGGCPRAFVRHANGFTPKPLPPFIQEIYAEGHLYEATIIAMAGLEGQVVDQQREYDLPLGRIGTRQVVVRCHIDGLHQTLIPTIVEAKKFRDSTWATWKRKGIAGFPHYEWQTSVIHATTGHDVLLLPGHLTINKTTGKKEITETDSLLVEPKYTALDIKRRVKMIELACQAEDLDVACEPMYPCPFFPFHDGDAEQRPDVTTGELRKLIQRERKLVAARDKADAEHKVASLALKAAVIGAGYKGERMAIAGFNVTHVNGWVAGGSYERKGYQQDFLKITVKEKDDED